MIYKSKGGSIKIQDTDMDYISFGKGSKTLVVIPGLSDGLKTVKGSGLVFSMILKKYIKDYKIYVFSRKNKMEVGYSTKDMAKDQKLAMEKLGISKAHIIGISQGGMIAQHFAVDYPEMVEKLVIAVSVSRQNHTIQTAIKSWIDMAISEDYKSLVIDTIEKTYTGKNLKINRIMYPISTRLGRPKSFDRFIIQANSCINHNAYDELDKITCPTLVIGGDSDKVVGENTSQEMAKMIKDSKLIIYEGLGHGAFVEARDFNDQILNFFRG